MAPDGPLNRTGPRTDDRQPLDGRVILPEPDRPRGADLLAEGRHLAGLHRLGPSAFLEHFGVDCEVAYKRRCAATGTIMQHAQIGWRDPVKTRRAWAEIHDAVAAAGGQVDRYGICLDWSMGYPAARRHGMPRGTGMILERSEDWCALTAMAPVAPHFGDFVIGMPAAVENTAAALAAGATTIGNLGQYFTFRLPHWDDDVATTAATVTALALCAAQPVPILIHSNLDDGFAAQFADLACTLGAVLLERHVVGGLIGGQVGHCYGHTFSDPVARLAFQRALAGLDGGDESPVPGTMIYGNTTAYGPDPAANHAALAGYLLVDIAGQAATRTGHAVNPVPVTEALRIPEVEEVIDAQRFATRLIDRHSALAPLIDVSVVDAQAETLKHAARRFRDRVLAGLEEAGIDTADPFDLLLALRRIGGRRLETLFGPGAADPDAPRGRRPVVKASPLAEIEARADAEVAALSPIDRSRLAERRPRACLATTDVHEFGKLMLETICRQLGLPVTDAGVTVDPAVLAATARDAQADFIAVSSYNGVALDYVLALKAEMRAINLDIPLYVGGKLNRIPDRSNSSLPVDVAEDIAAVGARPCRTAAEMLRTLAADQPEPGDGPAAADGACRP